MSKTTPLESLHKQLGAEMGQFSGWELPVNYGDANAELSAVETSCCAFDLSGFGRITVKGSDAKTLIDTLLATETSSLSDGCVVNGFCCDDQGEIVDFVRVSQSKSSFMLLTTPAGREKVIDLVAQVRQQKALSVNVDDVTEKTAMVAVYGKTAVQALNNIVPLDLASIQKGQIKNFSIFMMSITVLNSSWLDTDGMELICPAGAAKFAGGAIEKYHKQENIVPAGMECLERLMTAKYSFSGISSPITGKKPADLGLADKLDLSKDFVGKTALV